MDQRNDSPPQRGISIHEMTESPRIQCPYCGESFEVTADCSAGDQEYVEDCPVCCRPNRIRVEIDDDGDATVWAEPEQDYN